MDDEQTIDPIEANDEETVSGADPAMIEDEPAALDDVGLVRAFILEHDAAIVPELVMGGNVPEVLASVVAARAAYARVADQVRSAVPPEGVTPVAPAIPTVPAGGAAAFVVDPATLPAGELIRRGVTAARRG